MIFLLTKDMTSVKISFVRYGPPDRMKVGGIAQLGERLNGIQEVSGSIPLISTNNVKSLETNGFKAFFLPFLPIFMKADEAF